MKMSVNTMHDQYQQQQQENENLELLQKSYRSALSELTFNSKPIITNLTIMAEENQMAAAVIVKEIETRSRINAAGQKLPIFYLIDSICKNVGGVYITIFGRNMVNVFLDAYTLCEQSVKERFERLLQTWKNGLSGGRPVFARHIIEPIEKSIIYIREKQASNNIHFNPQFLQKDKLQTSRRDPRIKNSFAQPAKEENALSSPIATILTQLQILDPKQQSPHISQTNSSLSTEINPVKQLIGQIQAILPTLPLAQANSIGQYISQIVSTPINSVDPIINSTHVSSPLNKPSLVALPLAPYSAPPAKVDTADLLKGLTSMGYLKPTRTVENVSPFLLDSKDLQIHRPGAIESLYSAQPLQCKQCGLRYPDTEKGQQRMDAHLDSHFRQNRKMKERLKRGLSRSWFVTENEWIHGEGGESMSQQVPTFLQDGAGHTNKTEGDNSKEEIMDPNQYTVIKQTDERITCPICGETFVDFWNDDEEEWMYKNAIMDDKIYHASCHSDAVQSGNLETGLKRKSEDKDSPKTKQQRTE